MAPMRKGYAKRKALAMAMNAIVSKRKSIEELTPPPVSPDVTINQYDSERRNVTTMSREMMSLEMTERVKPSERKDSGNRIIHWDSLHSLVSSNLGCKKCGADVSLTETTVGIATQIKLTCKNQRCNLCEKNEVNKTNSKTHNFRKNSSESFAINCQFVLALMQSGCGGSEASVLLTFLDLPHSSTFHKSTFPRIQEAIRPAIKELSEKSEKEAREAEVLATIGADKFDDWKNKKLKANDVKLTISYDMGWNKRSSGNKYDSISGHGFVLGKNTKKILQHRVLSKVCSKCSIAAKKM